MGITNFILEIQLTNTTKNHNKFYNMKRKSRTSPTFVVEYGKIGNSARTTTYEMSKWNMVLKDKLDKGYRIISEERENDVSHITLDDNKKSKLMYEFGGSSGSYIDEYGGVDNSLVVLTPNGINIRVKELKKEEQEKFLEKIDVLLHRIDQAKTKTINKPDELSEYLTDIKFIKKYLESDKFITKSSLKRLIEIFNILNNYNK